MRAAGRAAGYGICTDFGGHGVGRAMHEDPHIPNEGPPGRGRRLVPGLVIAIEPWFLAGGKDVYQIDDARQVDERIGEEIRVFEYRKDRQVEYDARGQHRARARLDRLRS